MQFQQVDAKVVFANWKYQFEMCMSEWPTGAHRGQKRRCGTRGARRESGRDSRTAIWRACHRSCSGSLSTPRSVVEVVSPPGASQHGEGSKVGGPRCERFEDPRLGEGGIRG